MRPVQLCRECLVSDTRTGDETVETYPDTQYMSRVTVRAAASLPDNLCCRTWPGSSVCRGRSQLVTPGDTRHSDWSRASGPT